MDMSQIKPLALWMDAQPVHNEVGSKILDIPNMESSRETIPCPYFTTAWATPTAPTSPTEGNSGSHVQPLNSSKVILYSKLGNLDWCTTWLEGLAAMQVAKLEDKHSNNPGKRLKQLLHMEEQQAHAQQIWQVNGTARWARSGLAEVLVVQPDDT